MLALHKIGIGLETVQPATASDVKALTHAAAELMGVIDSLQRTGNPLSGQGIQHLAVNARALLAELAPDRKPTPTICSVLPAQPAAQADTHAP